MKNEFCNTIVTLSDVDGAAVGAQLRQGVRVLLFVAAPDRNSATGPGQRVRHAKSDPAVAAGDDRDAPGQIEIAHVVLAPQASYELLEHTAAPGSKFAIRWPPLSQTYSTGYARYGDRKCSFSGRAICAPLCLALIVCCILCRAAQGCADISSKNPFGGSHVAIGGRYSFDLNF